MKSLRHVWNALSRSIQRSTVLLHWRENVQLNWQDPATVPVPLRYPSVVKLSDLRVAHHTDNGIIAASSDVNRTVMKANCDWLLTTSSDKSLVQRIADTPLLPKQST